MEFDFNKILLEVAWRTDTGIPDFKNAKHLTILEEVLDEFGTPSNVKSELINNLKNPDAIKNTDEVFFLDLAKKAWDKIKNVFKLNASNAISQEMDKIESLEDEVTIKIPLEIPESKDELLEDAKSDRRGKIGEFLTAHYIISKDGENISILKNSKVVDLDSIAKNDIQKIESELQLNKIELKSVDKQYDIIYRNIDFACQNMASYIISEVNKKSGTIVGVEHMGGSGQKPGKGDLKLRVKQNFGKEMIKKYSIKVYTKLPLNIDNSTPYTLIESLTTVEIANKFKLKILKNEDIQKLIQLNKDAEKKYNNRKDNREDDSDTEELMRIRKETRSPLNKIYASEITQTLLNFIKDPSNKKIFINNVLKRLGFKSKDTKLLVALTGNIEKHNKVKLLVGYPKLDFTDIKIANMTDRGEEGISVHIINGKGEKIVTYAIKEAKSVASFLDIPDSHEVNTLNFFSDKGQETN